MRSGRLYSGPALDCPLRYALGPVWIVWDPAQGGQLVVQQRHRAGRVLWASVRGAAFVGAGQGLEQAHESRGHVQISDRLHRHYCDQQITAISASGDSVMVRGTLHSRCGATLDYTLSFTAVQPDQLRFVLDVAAQQAGQAAPNRSFLIYASPPDERIFGFGVQYSFVDFKGKRLPIIVGEQGIGRGLQPLTWLANLRAGAGGAWHSSYASVPHYLSSQLRSLCLESAEYAVFDMRRPDRLCIELFAPRMVGRIFNGDTPAALIAAYTAFAGRMRPLPDWINDGAIVGLQGGTARVRALLARLDAYQVPIAALWLQDWVGQRRTSFGQQLWWNWELDEAHYAGWPALRDELAARGIRLLSYVNPMLVDVAGKAGARRNLFAEAAAQGFLVRTADGQPALIPITDFCAGLVDIFNPAAREWLIAVLTEQVLGTGVAGWMADFGEGLPYTAQLSDGTAAAGYRNRYPEAWAELNRAVIAASNQSADLVFFLRAGYTRSPQHATLFWLGDQLVSWDACDGIKTAVTGLLSGGLSGFSLNHSDIGGYTSIVHPLCTYRRSKELLLRWMELNAFTTIYRSHESNRPADNIQCYSDDTTLAHFSRFARVYRAWGFYRRQLVQEAASSGLPVLRHLFIHYPDDPEVYKITYQQFMLGSELLVAPVLDPGQRHVTVYLPAGRWVHLWSGQVYGQTRRGERIRVAAPLGQPGVFYRAGSEVVAEFVAKLQAID